MNIDTKTTTTLAYDEEQDRLVIKTSIAIPCNLIRAMMPEVKQVFDYNFEAEEQE